MDDFRADFQVLLDDALTAVAKLRERAAQINDGYQPEDAEFDATYQIWLDLERAHGELSRTDAGIKDGFI